MFKEAQVEKQSSVGKLIFYAMIVSGVIAAYLMYRRGESLVSIATKTVTHPVGSLISEVKNTV